MATKTIIFYSVKDDSEVGRWVQVEGKFAATNALTFDILDACHSRAMSEAQILAMYAGWSNGHLSSRLVK